MKLFHKRGGGVNRISYLLFRTAYVFRNTVKVLNKDFTKAVRGGHRFMKLFHKIPIFFKRWLPFSSKIDHHQQLVNIYPKSNHSLPKMVIYALFTSNVASRIYALLSSNPPECQDWGKGGSSQSWQCQDFESFCYINPSLTLNLCYISQLKATHATQPHSGNSSHPAFCFSYRPTRGRVRAATMNSIFNIISERNHPNHMECFILHWAE